MAFQFLPRSPSLARSPAFTAIFQCRFHYSEYSINSCARTTLHISKSRRHNFINWQRSERLLSWISHRLVDFSSSVKYQPSNFPTRSLIAVIEKLLKCTHFGSFLCFAQNGCLQRRTLVAPKYFRTPIAQQWRSWVELLLHQGNRQLPIAKQTNNKKVQNRSHAKKVRKKDEHFFLPVILKLLWNCQSSWQNCLLFVPTNHWISLWVFSAPLTDIIFFSEEED